MGFYDYQGAWHEDDADMDKVLADHNATPSAPTPSAPKAPYQDIAYWQNKGYGTNDMFDANGQTKPGWTRTANGYDYTAPAPAPAGRTGGGGGGATLPAGSIGSLLGEFGTPQPKYVDADSSGLWDQVGAAPNFPTLPTFTDPTGEQAANMPGYAFARDQALQGLTNSAAARGVTNTGGTLEDIVKFGNQFATQNYQTTRANALENYQNNIWAQYLAPYQAAQSNWQTKAGLVPSVASAASTNANNLNNFNRGTWQDSYAAWRNHGNDTFNRLFALDQLGANVQ